MNKIISFSIFAILCLLFCSCSTTAINSMRMADAGQTRVIKTGFLLDKNKLHQITLQSLHAADWQVDNSGNPIKARKSSFRQNAVVSILVTDATLEIETKGSTYVGNPYVPINYINHLIADIDKSIGIKR